MANGRTAGHAREMGPRERGGVPSHERSEHARPGTVDPGDLARLNSILDTNLRFAVEQARFDDPGGSEWEAADRRRGTRVPSLAATGVLMYEPLTGLHLSAAFPITCSGARRLLLHSLAGSLAECAMTLGLGVGVYRRGCGRALTARL